MPDEPEVLGLLALMLLHDARREARTGSDGQLVLLEDQDRSLWDRDLVDQGHELVLQAVRGRHPGRFALQAAIAALHGQAPSWEETDWGQILGLYNLLVLVWPSPVVALNRAVAVSMVRGPEAALVDLRGIEDGGRLAAYHYLPATKADFLRRLGRVDEARTAYREALALVGNEPERAFLTGRLAALD
jgi:RNA polymerase sigma-70 factor (ECF subfamily)